LIRRAEPKDAAAIAACVCAAYIHYIERIGRQPGPMLDDYKQVIRDKQVHVVSRDGKVVGAIVLDITDEGFYLENVAVDPASRGSGVGRALLEFAESEAMRQGFDSIFLATHEKMIENRELYAHIGYVQYDARVVNGFPRVFFRKALQPNRE
jgi:ribosomal protein S18 acetylase RimI-like enzyme